MHQKHFTTAEIQELNKFYSTEAMQNMVKKLPLLHQDLAPIELELTKKYFQNIDTRLHEELER